VEGNLVDHLEPEAVIVSDARGQDVVALGRPDSDSKQTTTSAVGMELDLATREILLPLQQASGLAAGDDAAHGNWGRRRGAAQ
jgi:hypothetical protein